MAVYENLDFRHLPAGLAPLFAEAGERSFFSLPGWYEILARHGTKAGVQSRLYVDAGGSAALACQGSVDGQDKDGRRLRSLSSYYSCEHAVLHGAAEPDGKAIAELVAQIAAERPAWDAVVLDALDPADPSFAALAKAFRGAGMAVRPFFDAGTWYDDTSGLSFAAYLAGRPSALRNTWRRKSAKLERSGRCRWSFYDAPAGVEPGIADYEAIYRASWKRAEPFPDFMPALMRFAADVGALRLGVVHCDGEPAAAQFWIVWRGRACIYKLAHDERFDELSLGTLLTMRMMERVLEQDRPAEVNFGRGDDPYKKLWFSQRRERWGLSAANPRTLRGLHLAARQIASGVVRRLRAGPPPPHPSPLRPEGRRGDPHSGRVRWDDATGRPTVISDSDQPTDCRRAGVSRR